MMMCHYDGPEKWAPCEFENNLTCKNCAYCWDDDDYDSTVELDETEVFEEDD